MGHFGYLLHQSTDIWQFMMVLTNTKTLSRVFILTSGEGQIVLVNICVILISFSITEDTPFHISVCNICLQKLHIIDNTIPVYKSIILLFILICIFPRWPTSKANKMA